jgi:hypothetical protein
VVSGCDTDAVTEEHEFMDAYSDLDDEALADLDEKLMKIGAQCSGELNLVDFGYILANAS